MIYTDGIHIVSDVSEAELEAYCNSIGIKRCWFHRGRHPHYDVPKRMRGSKLPGARVVSPREIIAILKKRGITR